MSSSNLAALATHFKSLHVPFKPVILTNVFSASGARLALAHPRTKALATASYAIAAEHGVEDDDLPASLNLSATKIIAAEIHKSGKANTIGLTADLQSGYGDELPNVIREAIKAGVIGCNLEDSTSHSSKPIPVEEHVARIRKVIEVAKEEGVPDFVVNARCDVLWAGGDVEECISRGKEYLKAGAVTVFFLGGPRRGGITVDEVKRLVEGLDKKVSFALMDAGQGKLGVKELAEMGVARISMGPGLWMVQQKAAEGKIAEVLGEAEWQS